MAETPRTDAQSCECGAVDGCECCPASLARQLETELSKAAARLDELGRQLVNAQKEARAFYALSEERRQIIEATRRQLATARQDAERYRWLRSHADADISIKTGEDEWTHAMFKERLDNAVDAAIRALEGQT